MSKTAIIYWPKGGSVENAATRIYNQLKDRHADVSIFEITETDISELCNYDTFLVGGSTVGADNWTDAYSGEQWGPFHNKVKETKPDLFKGKKVALFGLGDQILYPHDYVNDMKLLFDRFIELHADLTGLYIDNNYDFIESDAFINGMFIGLALDQKNQDNLTDGRISKWLDSLLID